jgi:hypothetical protein
MTYQIHNKYALMFVQMYCSGWMRSANDGPRFQRPAPPKYTQKFQKMSLSDDTANLYAMLEYFDDQVGGMNIT